MNAIFVRIPKYMGGWEPASLWSVIETDDPARIRDYLDGRMLNDAGEWVELPAHYIEFATRELAEQFIFQHMN